MTLLVSMVITQLKKYEIDGYLFNTSDCHSNEYIGGSDLRLQNITNFTGSNALGFISREKSLLWTDGRYHIQATKELDNRFELIKEYDSFFDQINENGGKIGLDKRLFTISSLESYKKKCKKVEFVHVDDLIDLIKPPVKKKFKNVINLEGIKIKDFIVHEEVFKKIDWLDFEGIYLDDNVTGSRRIDKLAQIREKFNDNEVLIITALDEIAWLFNMRGADIDFNPVFYSYAIVDKEETYLFSNSNEIQNIFQYKEDGNNNLGRYAITVKKYEDFDEYLKAISNKQIKMSKEVNSYVYETLKNNQNEITFVNYISEAKSVKNRTEILGFLLAHIYDAVYLCKLFEWIENRVDVEITTEIDVSKQLEMFKKKNTGFVSPSFDTISSFGSNGAIIHHKGSSTQLGKDSLFLLDSGSQYYFGTTDVTRTVCFGNPTSEQKKMFTTVLKGQIDAITAVIPKKTKSSVLDAYARTHLWKLSADFAHSTGHGVGHFLNVHEAPPSISANGEKLLPNMIFSIEPGYYKENDYGIRIEDLVVTKEKDNDFLEIINLTLAPLQKKMIEEEMLALEHKKYLKEFNARARSILQEFMEEGELGYSFMMRNTGE